jgi:hypothetical protein
VVEQSIRNRQVVGSIPTLGSNIPLKNKELAESLNHPRLFCCIDIAYFKLFRQRIERSNLRFIYGLDVDILR